MRSRNGWQPINEHQMPSTDHFGRQKVPYLMLQRKPLAKQNVLTITRRQLSPFSKPFYVVHLKQVGN